MEDPFTGKALLSNSRAVHSVNSMSYCHVTLKPQGGQMFLWRWWNSL
jgi:hypothetical protein